MNTANQNTARLVQDRKTGEWYNPEQKFAELQNAEWFKKLLQRMKNR